MIDWYKIYMDEKDKMTRTLKSKSSEKLEILHPGGSASTLEFKNYEYTNKEFKGSGADICLLDAEEDEDQSMTKILDLKQLRDDLNKVQEALFMVITQPLSKNAELNELREARETILNIRKALED